MSEENVEVVLAAVDAVNRRDPDAFVACLHPDVEWQEDGDPFPGLKGTYRGRIEMREWFYEAIVELWESLTVNVEEITQAPEDGVFLGFSITASGKGSGAETELRGWQVLTCADDKIARRLGPYWARAEALKAAGLRE